MKKSRITTRIKDKTGIAKSKNRSEDLVGLRSKYQQFSKNLRFLITTLTNNHNAMAAYSKSRLEVAKAINSLTVDTPLFGCAGDIPATAVGTTDGGGGSTDVVPHQSNPTSYAAIHLQLHKKHKLYYDKYQEHILSYATEWERILSTRIAGHLKQSEKLRVDLDHYGKKVEDLNKTHNKTMSKGKTVTDSGVDKLKRNEQKLVQARQEYDRFVNDLCGFMEEVMERGWKDLHPLLVKMAQFDSTLSGEEANLLKGSMVGVTEQMKGMAGKYPNLKPTGRLKELETFSLESLSKLNPAMRSDSPLMITQGGGESPSYMTGTGDTGGSSGIHADLIGGRSNDELANVGGGGGLFGGPTNTSQRQMSRNDSFASSNSATFGQPRSRNNTGESFDWTTGTHLTAPAPAAGAGAGPGAMARAGSYRAAPASGGLPPLGAQQRMGSFTEPPQRSHSTQDMSAASMATSSMLSSMQAAAPPPTLDDIFRSSESSAVTGPPAGMPPPPPSMPPPPPPQAANMPQMGQLSLYGNQPATQHALSPMAAAGGGYMSPSGQTATSGNTNPFDDAFGAAPVAAPAYGNPPAPAHNPYGTGGSTSTNPFG